MKIRRGSWVAFALILGLLVAAGVFYYTLLPQNIGIPESESAHAFVPAAKPAPSVDQAVPPGEAAAQPPASAATEMTLMRTGKMLSKQGFAWRGGKLAENYDFGMASVVLKRANGDLYLFDAGFGENVQKHTETTPWLMRKLSTILPEATVSKQLFSAAIMKDKVKAIYLSHSHWDHVSGLEDFPGVEVRMSSAELDFIKSGKYPGLIDQWIGNLNVKTFDFTGGPYENFDKSHDVFGDGTVVMVPMPGHTEGSTGMFVNLASGKRYFFTGDITWAIEGFQLPAERTWLARKLVDYDEEGVRNAIAKVHLLMKKYPDLVVVPAHDRRAHDKLKQFPEYEK